MQGIRSVNFRISWIINSSVTDLRLLKTSSLFKNLFAECNILTNYVVVLIAHTHLSSRNRIKFKFKMCYHFAQYSIVVEFVAHKLVPRTSTFQKGRHFGARSSHSGRYGLTGRLCGFRFRLFIGGFMLTSFFASYGFAYRRHVIC